MALVPALEPLQESVTCSVSYTAGAAVKVVGAVGVSGLPVEEDMVLAALGAALIQG